MRMPVATGRDVALLVEIAARNHLLKRRGYNAAKEMAARVHEEIARRTASDRDRRKTPRRGASGRETHERSRRRAAPPRRHRALGIGEVVRGARPRGHRLQHDRQPPAVAPSWIHRRSGVGGRAKGRTAVVLDVRNPGFAEAFPALLDELRTLLPVTVVFLDADDPTIFRRFSETRRPHPLAQERTLTEAVAWERRLLAEVKGKADLVLDTTAMTVHELRSVLAEHFRAPGDPGVLAVSIVSFGFKHGVPPSIDLCFDVRFLANPHFVPELRPRTGRDPDVARFIEEGGTTVPFYRRLLEFLLFCLPNYRRENRAYLTIGVGCTGGATVPSTSPSASAGTSPPPAIPFGSLTATTPGKDYEESRSSGPRGPRRTSASSCCLTVRSRKR